jgi:arginine decarboxylase
LWRVRSAVVPGAQAWAGIGWVQDASGRGLPVEHHGGDEKSLRGLVRASLSGLCRNRGVSFPSGGTEVAGAQCVDEPVCALVVAVFGSAAWMSAHRPAAAAVAVAVAVAT